MPELSGRQNIVVIADEAHRSQYGFGGKVNEKTGGMSYGFASNLRDALPYASFIGFTGTPIEKTDANTRAVFGDYISFTYTKSGGQGNPTFDAAQAIAVTLEKHGIACDLMHGFNWDKWTSGTPTERLQPIPAVLEHIQSSSNRKTPGQMDAAIRQLVSKAMTTEGQVMDVFTAAGLTPSPPAQSGFAQCCALSVPVAPLAPSAVQAGHQHPERPIPRRSARPQAQKRRR